MHIFLRIKKFVRQSLNFHSLYLYSLNHLCFPAVLSKEEIYLVIINIEIVMQTKNARLSLFVKLLLNVTNSYPIQWYNIFTFDTLIFDIFKPKFSFQYVKQFASNALKDGQDSVSVKVPLTSNIKQEPLDDDNFCNFETVELTEHLQYKPARINVE